LRIRGIASTGVLHDDLKLEALKSHVTSGLKSGELRPKIAKVFRSIGYLMLTGTSSQASNSQKLSWPGGASKIDETINDIM
jgi:hypothetical protein